MATWMYKDDKKELVPTKRVQFRLQNGWSVEKPKRKPGPKKKLTKKEESSED